MQLNALFTWIKEGVANAVVAGFTEGADRVNALSEAAKSEPVTPKIASKPKGRKTS